MIAQNNSFDFGDNNEPTEIFTLYENIISDRGSTYSVSIGRVGNREDIKQFLKVLKSNKKYHKATHNSWAAVLTKDRIQYETKNDDGETGAGMVILRALKKGRMQNTIVCVTRWFGGVKLMGDRFRHVQDATEYALNNVESTRTTPDA